MTRQKKYAGNFNLSRVQENVRLIVKENMLRKSKRTIKKTLTLEYEEKIKLRSNIL